MEKFVINNQLKLYREALNMTQGEFAALLGVHRVTYNKWENQKEQPNTQSLYDIWIRLKEKIPGLNMQDLLDAE